MTGAGASEELLPLLTGLGCPKKEVMLEFLAFFGSCAVGRSSALRLRGMVRENRCWEEKRKRRRGRFSFSKKDTLIDLVFGCWIEVQTEFSEIIKYENLGSDYPVKSRASR